MAVGRTFAFHGHPQGLADADYLIATCSFVVIHPGYEGMEEGEGR